MQTQIKVSQKLWTKYYILVIIYNLLTSTASYMLLTGIPLYTIHLGGNNSMAGLMLGVFMISAISFRPFWGNLLDSKSRKLVLVFGAVISTLVYISYQFAFSIGTLLFLRGLNGVGFGASTNASGTVASDVIPKTRLAEGVGYFGISNTLATAVGPALSLFIIKNYNYDVLFLLTFALGILSFLCSIFIDYEKKSYTSAPPKQFGTSTKGIAARKSRMDVIFEKTALPTGLVIIFLATTIGGVMTFMPTYAATRGIQNIGIYFVVYAVALLFTRFFAGRIADRYGDSKVILPGMIFMIMAFIILAFATSLPVFLLSAVLYGLGYGSAQPTLNTVMIRLCPIERRGAGNSTFFTAMDFGVGGGAVIWGVISQNAGFVWVYLSCAASVSISLIAYIFVLQRQLKKQTEGTMVLLKERYLA